MTSAADQVSLAKISMDLCSIQLDADRQLLCLGVLSALLPFLEAWLMVSAPIGYLHFDDPAHLSHEVDDKSKRLTDIPVTIMSEDEPSYPSTKLGADPVLHQNETNEDKEHCSVQKTHNLIADTSEKSTDPFELECQSQSGWIQTMSHIKLLYFCHNYSHPDSSGGFCLSMLPLWLLVMKLHFKML
ncbi:unnamed protein product [Protopolystoma xenopodis]|uniref:Uncharacterized protein n=1 Tax=Protopolystoma xenopodis TaxID=117903 RepID=A0A448WT78_9PLAT|nr:unnamed protein product [Protopolystoma xenopodis]